MLLLYFSKNLLENIVSQNAADGEKSPHHPSGESAEFVNIKPVWTGDQFFFDSKKFLFCLRFKAAKIF